MRNYNFLKNKKGAVALNNFHAIYCLVDLISLQYKVEIILSATAPFLLNIIYILMY